MSSKALTRDEILAVEDIQTEKVDVPEWGGHVFVRGLTGTQRDAYQQSIVTTRGRDTQVNFRNATSKLVVLSVVHSEVSGRRLFTDADVKLLARKSAAALQRVFNVATRLSGLEREDIEEMAENLDEILSEDSGFDSVLN